MPTVPNSTLTLDNLPQGIDRADGIGTGTYGGPKLGTATTGLSVFTPDGTNTTEAIPLNELPDSPTIERAEQGTCTHKYTLSYSEGLNRLQIYGRGTLVRDSGFNYWRVLSSSLQRMRGDSAVLTLTTESVSFDNPPDEFQVTPVKMGIDILKHPRYFYALMPSNQIPKPWPPFVVEDSDAQIAAKQAIIRAIQVYRENPFAPSANTLNNMSGVLHDVIGMGIASEKIIYTVPNPNFTDVFPATKVWPIGTKFSGHDVAGSGTNYPDVATDKTHPNPQYYYVSFDVATDDTYGTVALALAAAKEIIGKLWRMEDSPMVNAVEITLSQYWFRPPDMNLGGYIEDPSAATTNPQLPDYFTSKAYPPNSTSSIFTNLAKINPQCFSSTGDTSGTTTISWLRDADTIEYQRTWFRVTSKWLGAPIGAWDADIYSTGTRPYVPDMYKNLIYA